MPREQLGQGRPEAGRRHRRHRDRRAADIRGKCPRPVRQRTESGVAVLRPHVHAERRRGTDLDALRGQGAELLYRVGVRVVGAQRGGRARVDPSRPGGHHDRGRSGGRHHAAGGRQLREYESAVGAQRQPADRQPPVRQRPGRVRDGRRRGGTDPRGVGARAAPRREDLRRGRGLRPDRGRAPHHGPGARRLRSPGSDAPRDARRGNRARSRRLHQRPRDLYAARRRRRDRRREGRVR